jgi:hypothetical protein
MKRERFMYFQNLKEVPLQTSTNISHVIASFIGVYTLVHIIHSSVSQPSVALL